MSEMETEIERRVESEPNGSSVLCESTTVVGSVGGLRVVRSQYSCLVRQQHKSSGAEGPQELLASREASNQQQQAASNSLQ